MAAVPTLHFAICKRSITTSTHRKAPATPPPAPPLVVLQNWTGRLDRSSSCSTRIALLYVTPPSIPSVRPQQPHQQPEVVMCALTDCATDKPFHKRFRVQARLEDALYGPVLLCQDLTDMETPNQSVAVKLVSLRHWRHCKQSATSVAAKGRIDDPWREKCIVQRLQAVGGHPNVLKYHEILEEDHGAVLVFVMEFCAQGDLQQALHSTPLKRFEEPKALDLFQQIVDGVEFLHKMGLAHRDLSLENVLLTSDGICKVCDFGLCVKSTIACVGPVGKSYYMAPEVVSGKVYDPNPADVWSLGVMLFMLVTGFAVCDLAEPNDVAFEIVKTAGPERLLQLWGIEKLVSQPTLRLLNGMLQVDPTKRLRMDEIQQLLGSVQLPESIRDAGANCP